MQITKKNRSKNVFFEVNLEALEMVGHGREKIQKSKNRSVNTKIKKIEKFSTENDRKTVHSFVQSQSNTFYCEIAS